VLALRGVVDGSLLRAHHILLPIVGHVEIRIFGIAMLTVLLLQLPI